MQSRPVVCGANHYQYKGSAFAVSSASSVYTQHTEGMHRKHVQVILKGETLMAKRNVRYPDTIGFRVTDETWLRILQEVAETDLTPHDWCRMVVLDRLDYEYGFSKKDRLLFQTIVRTQFFVAFSFQMLADDNLTTDEWKKMRTYAKEKADYLAKQSVADFRSRMECNAQQSRS
jgi:hypothetical protein